MNLDIGWLLSKDWSIYPQQRPLEGATVRVGVLDLSGRFLDLGVGQSNYCNECGICINVNSVVLDSNSTFLWKIVN